MRSTPLEGGAGSQPVPSQAPERRVALDDRLKELIQRLGNVINESLSESESLAEVIGEIRETGYDVFLVIEATIGFNKREGEEASPLPEAASGLPIELTFTDQDQAFLKALKINVEE